MNENKLIYKFSHTDEFGDTCNFERELSVDSVDTEFPFENLVEQFKCFLLAQGYSSKTVDKLQIEE